jgi:hypothetical protein
LEARRESPRVEHELSAPLSAPQDARGMKHLTLTLLLAAAVAAATIALGTRSAPPAGASSATPAATHVVHVPTRADCRRLFARDEPRDLGPCLADADR